MASNTENLNLYKKDPIADKDETFNIQTMMNDNWVKIDQFAGETISHMAQIMNDWDFGLITSSPTSTDDFGSIK